MNSRWRNRLLIGLAITIAAVVVISLIRPAQAAIEEEEIRSFISNQFDGQIYSFKESTRDEQDVYEIELLAEAGIYEIIVDPYSGNILSLTHALEREEVDPSKWEKEEEAPPNKTLSVEEVRGLVQSEIGEEVTILEIELKEDDGLLFYDVKVRQSNGTSDLELDATTGEVLVYTLKEDNETPNAKTTEPAEKKENKKASEANPKETIREKEAKRIALSHVAGKVVDVDLEEEDGRLFYEVEIEIESEDVDAEVLIDAITGEVITIIWED